jgi:acyl-CoA synthetase (AMP-forming)/AMP-acid ligase II
MVDFLTAHALAQPDKLAVIDDRPDGTFSTMTYAQLNERANRLANVLLALGVTPGASKLVWCGQNSPGLVLVINAARKLGITAVPLNYRLSDEEAAYVTDHSDATFVLITSWCSMRGRTPTRCPSGCSTSTT